MKLKWTRAALADLQQILDFVAHDNPQAARAPAAGFRQTAEYILNLPSPPQSKPGVLGSLAGTMVV